MTDRTEPTAHVAHATGERPHPGPRTYIKIAILLVVITTIEVGLFYVEALDAVIIPIFLILSATKFVMVVMFYMHLKFDSRLFAGFFVGGLLLAVTVGLALLTLIGALF